MLLPDLIDGDYLLSMDKTRLNISYIHEYLSTKSYWAESIPKYLVERSIQNSLCFGVYHHQKQIGFARVITDHATFAYLADVFIDENYRGKGLSKKLMAFIQSLEEMKIMRRFMLGTRDAHGLYAQYNFKPLKFPERFMEVAQPDIYKSLKSI